MISAAFKKRIHDAVRQDRDNYPSASKQAISLGINSAQLSRINSGEIDQVLSDQKWYSIARRLSVSVTEEKPWETAITPVFSYIKSQLEYCQKNGVSGLLCDNADIGKTHSAKHYVNRSKNAVYIDCSQVKSKQKLIRRIAREFGLGHIGRYADVYEDLIYYLQCIEHPLVVLDEAGDLDYPAFLELKALWNATERCCGWYMMGADGLRAKIESNLGRQKVGYVELFSRFGQRYQKITPNGGDEFQDFKIAQLALIANANGQNVDPQRMFAKTDGSLRRLRTELLKVG